ncbi:MAG: hypothetical protein K9G67_15900 [Bacteroidales bacterium]|nr:hypothetical protein [Bacteroidales bacterium]MCF8352179.1 hypothetical protein [Bacteroidales bacterium]MCF8377839.1 hypothetical protein [Bacteroidales bacterium]MCF8402201.1 hypothetical protein [Bacteroidales bacterium]
MFVMKNPGIRFESFKALDDALDWPGKSEASKSIASIRNAFMEQVKKD